MRIPHSILGLLAFTSGLVGCTQTGGGLRIAGPSDVKTTASVGDKSLPVVAGLPGEEGRVAAVAPDSRRSADARISGRVYDAEGEPVRNAVVRLAMSGAAGGKLVHATTDRSGAFTLRGLRPGSSYTVIAEFQGDQGMMTGRADADAPETDLRISLRPRDSAVEQGGPVAVAPGRSRVEPVARAEEIEEDDEPAVVARRPRPAPSKPVRPRLDAAAEVFDEIPTESPRRVAPADAPMDDEDGENPLPPAREISQVSARGDELPPVQEPGEDAPRTLPDNFIGGDRLPARTSQAEPPKAERARPKWSDVVASAPDVPMDEQVEQTTAVQTNAPPPVAEARTSDLTSAPIPSSPARAPASLEARRQAPYCDYDPDQNRILGLAMFDINGKKVSIHDFDAELILLDFWGSWCVQCRPALEHMKELQSRLGGRKLQVVSVAYEKTPKEGRAAKLGELVQSLRINYPVLMTDFSDPCPIRETLAVDVFPTMILIDREGKILRRERGATPATLANIDRAVADHLERGERPQYARREPRGRASR